MNNGGSSTPNIPSHERRHSEIPNRGNVNRIPINQAHLIRTPKNVQGGAQISGIPQTPTHHHPPPGQIIYVNNSGLPITHSQPPQQLQSQQQQQSKQHLPQQVQLLGGAGGSQQVIGQAPQQQQQQQQQQQPQTIIVNGKPVLTGIPKQPQQFQQQQVQPLQQLHVQQQHHQQQQQQPQQIPTPILIKSVSQIPVSSTNIPQQQPQQQQQLTQVISTQHFIQQTGSSQHPQSNDELLVKELEGYKKKCIHLEQHILQFKQQLEVTKITETQLTEVLTENRNFEIENNDLLMKIALLKQENEQNSLRVSQTNIFEAEYLKLQELYSQQMRYIDQLKNDLTIKNSSIQELQHKDEMNQRTIQSLHQQMNDLHDHQEDQVKRNKQQKQNLENDVNARIGQLTNQLEEKDKEIQNILLILENSESAKNQWEIQIQTFTLQISSLQNEIRSRDDQIHLRNTEIERLRETVNQMQLTIYQLNSVEQEKQRLMFTLEGKDNEIEQWRNQYAELNLKLEELRQQNTKIFAMENKIVSLTIEIERLRQMNEQKDEDVKRSRNRQGELEKDVEDKKQLVLERQQFEVQLRMYSSELEQMRQVIGAKQSEIEDLKQQLNNAFTLQYTVQHNETVILSLNQRITTFENELKLAKERVVHLENENNVFRKQAQDYLVQISSYQSEINSLKSLTNDYNQIRLNVSEQEYKVLGLTQTITNLTLIVQQKEGEIDVVRGQLKKSQEDNDRLKRAVGEMSTTLQQLEITLYETNVQLNDLKDQQQLNADLIAQNGELKSIFSQLELKYQELIRTSRFEKEQLENKLVLVSTENSRKELIIASKEKETDSLRLQLIQFTDIQIQYRQTQDKIAFLLHEIDRITSENQFLGNELEVIRIKYSQVSHFELQVNDLLGRIVLQSAEIEALRSLVASNKQENQNLRASQLLQYRN